MAQDYDYYESFVSKQINKFQHDIVVTSDCQNVAQDLKLLLPQTVSHKKMCLASILELRETDLDNFLSEYGP